MIQELREKAARLPMNPGVYIMMDSTGKVIYVGKARHLKNRVSSYFTGSHNAKTEAMIAKIDHFDVIIANSEFEALVLENSLIKHHMPKYNILLKDDKGYPFIRLDTDSLYPRFTIASRPENDGARYFGPFKSRGTVNAAIDAVCKALRLPTCRKRFPRDIGKSRPCLNYHMGHCRGYCLRDARREEYLAAVRDAVLIFEGRAGRLTEQLRGEMERAADSLQFELAAEYRDRLRAVESLQTRQLAWSASSVDTDAVGFYRGETRSCFVVLHYHGGVLLDKDFEVMENPLEEDDGEVLSSLVRQYYAGAPALPRSILLSAEPPDGEALSRFINERAGYRVYLTVPKRGDKDKLVETAVLNAREEVQRVTTREEKAARTAVWLQNALGLERPPVRIESFDISNTGDADIVASMVVFVSGRPSRRDYRKFKMKEQTTQDDYACMAEALRRRFQRYADGDEKFSPLPDLLLVDGGRTHAAVAEAVVNEFLLEVPVLGMVKDDRHRTRALITAGGEEIGITGQPYIFSFIGTIQEETHRFAVTYHRHLHSRSTLVSQLSDIPGVGEKRREALLKRFGSVKAIRGADVAALARVVPESTARAIYRYFHGESGE